MNKLFTISTASIVVLIALPVLAESVTNKVVAYDRVAHRVVLEDKTIFTFDPAAVAIPDTLDAGDEVKIDYKSAGDDGIVKIDSITIVKEGAGG